MRHGGAGKGGNVLVMSSQSCITLNYRRFDSCQPGATSKRSASVLRALGAVHRCHRHRQLAGQRTGRRQYQAHAGSLRQTPGAVHRRAWPPAHRDRAHRGPQLPHQGPDRGLSITPASFPVGRHQSAIPVKPRQQFETGQIAACSGRRPQLHRLLAAFLPTDGHRCPVAGDRLSAPAAGADVRAHLAVLAVAPHPGRHVSRTAQAVGACHRLACRRRAQLDLSVGAVRSVKILAGWRIGAAAAGGENSPLDPLEEAICGELIASAQRPAELSVR